jgi:hypothetical protein
MPNFHGSFVGNVNSQAMTTVKDVPHHELGLVQISGPQTVSDPLWNGAPSMVLAEPRGISAAGSTSPRGVSSRRPRDTIFLTGEQHGK